MAKRKPKAHAPAKRSRIAEQYDLDLIIERLSKAAREILETCPPYVVFDPKCDPESAGLGVETADPTKPPYPVEDDAPENAKAASGLMFWIDSMRRFLMKKEINLALVSAIHVGRFENALGMSDVLEMRRQLGPDIDTIVPAALAGVKVGRGRIKSHDARRANTEERDRRLAVKVKKLIPANGIQRACELVSRGMKRDERLTPDTIRKRTKKFLA